MEIKSNKTKRKIALNARLVTKKCAKYEKNVDLPFPYQLLIQEQCRKTDVGQSPFLKHN